MDGRRFDEMARALAGAGNGTGSRRSLVRRALGVALAGVVLGRSGRALAQAATVAPGGACLSTDECLQTAGELTIVCGDNGIATDGELNCCRNAGGSCADGTGCCGSLECVAGVCGGGTLVAPTPDSGSSTTGLPVGAACTATAQCLPSTSGTVICATNNIAADGELNCCLQAGGQCGGQDNLCCGDLLCVDGACAVQELAYGDVAPGGTCAANLDCSQDGGPAVCEATAAGGSACCRLEVSNCATDAECCGALICGDNLIAEDGALTCCSPVGGVCGSDAACCGDNYCIDGTCQAPA